MPKTKDRLTAEERRRLLEEREASRAYEERAQKSA